MQNDYYNRLSDVILNEPQFPCIKNMTQIYNKIFLIFISFLYNKAHFFIISVTCVALAFTFNCNFWLFAYLLLVNLVPRPFLFLFANLGQLWDHFFFSHFAVFCRWWQKLFVPLLPFRFDRLQPHIVRRNFVEIKRALWTFVNKLRRLHMSIV